VKILSVSIDGKIHKGVITVKYGEPFPKANKSMEFHNETYGHVLVYIISLGQPKWTKKMTVEIPFRHYITQIIEPSEQYLRKKKCQKSNLTVIK